MSHIVTVKTKVQDAAAVAAACRRLGLPVPVEGTARLYSGGVTGLIVQLPAWKYPAVIDLTTGSIQFDNFGGHWGEQQKLDQFLQAYAVEKAKAEARGRGLLVNEQTLQDGSIKLQLRGGS